MTETTSGSNRNSGRLSLRPFLQEVSTQKVTETFRTNCLTRSWTTYFPHFSTTVSAASAAGAPSRSKRTGCKMRDASEDMVDTSYTIALRMGEDVFRIDTAYLWHDH